MASLTRFIDADLFLHEAMYIADHRSNDAHRKIQLADLRSAGQLVQRIVDAAHIGDLAIYHSEFAMQTSKDMSTHAQQRWMRIVNVNLHSRTDQRANEFIGQVR